MTLTPLERRCVENHRNAEAMEMRGRDTTNETAWCEFGLRLMLEAGAMVRDMRLLSMAEIVKFKADGSPYTDQERRIESQIKEKLAQFCPEAVLVGEESGGKLPRQGRALAVDPVDGTWALVNRSETCTTTFAFYQDNEAFLGMVQNPATGELAYAGRESGARLIQLSVFGEADIGRTLPCDRARPDSVLVNMQPQRDALRVAQELFVAWKDDDVSMLKLTGGSPSWSLLETAKGSYVYVNLWTTKPSDPFDLEAGVLIVRGAGGDVTDLDGIPIDPTTHSGPFVAGVDAQCRENVVERVKHALRD